jgi:hypothetical protein
MTLVEEINYISEIDYWLKQLKDEIKVAKFNITDNGIYMTRNIINNRSNNLILYTRALRDKLEND